ncbi:MAG: phage tail tape measure protein, partial [Chloroflexi bacterium]
MAESTLDINIKTDKAVANVNRLDNSLERLERQGNKTSRGFQSSTARIAKGAIVATAAIVAVGKAIDAVFGAIDTFRDFERSISNLSAITGATGDDLDYLSDSAKRLGAVTTLSASQVSEAFKLVASAKPDLLENVSALTAVTEATITLAEAAGIELPEAADALGNALNQFGLGAEEASRFINVLAAGSKFGAANIVDLSASLRDVGVVAASAGLSIEETVGALEVLGAAGLKAGRAGTGLRNVILKLQKEGIESLNPAVVGLTTALQNLAGEGRSTTDLIKVFGLETITVAQALLNGADAAGELTEKVTGTNTATEQAEINTDNLDGAIKRLASAYENLELKILESNTALKAFVDYIATGLLDLAPIETATQAYERLSAQIAQTKATLARQVEFGGGGSRQASESLERLRALEAEQSIALNNMRLEKEAADIATARASQNATAAAAQKVIDDEKLETNRRLAESERVRLELQKNALMIMNQFKTPMERLSELQFEIASAFQAGAINGAEYADTMTRIVSAMDSLAEKNEATETGIVKLDDAFQDFAIGATDAFVDFALGSEQAFSNFAESFLKQIAKMILQAQLFKALGIGSDGGFTGGGILGALGVTASAKGNAFDSGNVVPFAKGGVVNTPTLFPMAKGAGLMGEAGPEAVMPLTRGSDGKLGVKG